MRTTITWLTLSATGRARSSCTRTTLTINNLTLLITFKCETLKTKTFKHFNFFIEILTRDHWTVNCKATLYQSCAELLRCWETEFDLWILIYLRLTAAETSTTQNNHGKNDDFWCCMAKLLWVRKCRQKGWSKCFEKERGNFTIALCIELDSWDKQYTSR